MRNKDYIYLLRRKFLVEEVDGEDFQTLEARANFDDMLETNASASVHTVRYVKREDVGVDKKGINIKVNVTDVSKNDQKTNDEKYINFSWSMNPQPGDQIYWDNTWWVLYHKEHNSVLSHKTFTVKQCNFMYVYEYNGETYEIPTPLINLTLYSDGMSDKVYMSNADGKRRIFITNNFYTENIKIGQRIMLTNDTVFEITHIDDFTRQGIKECIMSQVFKVSKDDFENNLAYNESNILRKTENGILGSDYIYLGGNEVYTINTEEINELEVIGWKIEAEDNCVQLDLNYDGCRIICTDDISYIGTVVNIMLITATSGYVKKVEIKGVF